MTGRKPRVVSAKNSKLIWGANTTVRNMDLNLKMVVGYLNSSSGIPFDRRH